jgi:hypothetical protein
VPNITGFTYRVYIATAATMANATLGVVAASSPTQGPTTGAFAGLAVGIPAGATVIIGNNTGAAATPPAAPASGLTTYASFIIGRGAYGQVMLDDVKFTYLKEADKSDPLNQLRIVGWKCFYGTLIENQNFFMRVESVSAFGGGQQGFDHNVLQPS